MQCQLCGKRYLWANNVSHSNRRTKTRKYPNIQKIRAVVDGRRCRVQVCTSCIRSGKVSKV